MTVLSLSIRSSQGILNFGKVLSEKFSKLLLKRIYLLGEKEYSFDTRRLSIFKNELLVIVRSKIASRQTKVVSDPLFIIRAQ